MLKAGEYVAKLTGYQFGELNNAKRTPYIEISAEVDGEEILSKFWLSEGAIKYTCDKLEAFAGCKKIYSDEPGQPGDPINVDGLVGYEAPIIVKYDDEYKYPSFDFPKAGGNKKELAPETAEGIAAAMSALKAQLNKQMPWKKAEQESDVPF